MKRPLLRLLLLLCLAGFSEVGAQRLAVDTMGVPGAARVLALYQAAMGANATIFRGHEYIDYVFPFSKGHPYFHSDKWTRGSITYEGSTYTNVPLLYNLATDNIVVLHDSGLQKIQLVKDRVDSFSIAGHRFVHICANKVPGNGLRCGFYDVMATGTVNLLVRRAIDLQTVVDDKVHVNAESKNQYYLGRNGVYTPVRNKGDLLDLLSDHKKEVQQFIKKSRVRYRAQPEAILLRAVTFYNQLNG